MSDCDVEKMGELMAREQTEDDMKTFILKFQKLEKELLKLEEEMKGIKCKTIELKWLIDELTEDDIIY